MSEQLVIRLAETGLNAEQLVDWNLYDETGQLKDSGSSKLSTLQQQIASQSDQFHITVIVPGESVLLTSASVPSRQARQIKQALPFAVEELIADDIESVHIAIPSSSQTNSNVIDVAVVSHRILVDWLDELHSHQLSPNQILVDILCLPHQSNSLTLLVDNRNILIRTGDYSGLVVQFDDFKAIFTNLLAGLEQSVDGAIKPAINLIYSAQAVDDPVNELAESLRNQYPDYAINSIRYEESVIDIIAATGCIQHGPTLNLLQGGYSVNNTEGSHWQRWRVAASIAAIGVLGYLLVTLAGGWYFQNKAHAVDQQSVALYKQLFPNERRVVSPKKQMENHLRSSGAGDSGHFLNLLAQTAMQISGNDKELNILVEQLRFESDQGDLQFQVQSPSIEKLDQLKQLLAQQGLEVEINSASEQDDHIIGRLVVRSL